jgi:acetyltransferase-like isoleucine patch superfamily enzyme
MIRRMLRRILLRLLPAEVYEQELAWKKIAQCERSVILGKNSLFYEEAKVTNFRSRRDAIRIGENVHIRGELITFAFGGEIEIGDNVFIGTGSTIRSAEKITIGSNVLISHNCNIIDTDSHEMDYLERAESFKNMILKGHSKEKGNVATCQIVIEDYAWLSYNVSVLKGVKIGKGAVIGAGSVVTRDVAPFTIVAGNPARFIKNVE